MATKLDFFDYFFKQAALGVVFSWLLFLDFPFPQGC